MHRIDITRAGGRRRSLGMAESDVPFASNCVRLSPREWLIVAIIFSAVFCLAPTLWKRVERFEPENDYRLGYELSSDYWLYRRWCRSACSHYETVVIGDSVVWGHFVSKDNTLSHHLNKLTGRDRFANLGADGTHPAALEGLLRYYGKAISNKNVILHLNPLWMSSAKHDLQTDKEHHFNHPKLVAQFRPKIPCYKASCSERISAVVERHVPLFNWTAHLNITYFDGSDVPTWTIDHPYGNPLKRVTFRLPVSDSYERKADPAKVGSKAILEWVDLDTSLQWLFFKSSIELLRQRDNRVFVLVGPFNEHILDTGSIDAYREMQSEIEAWLRQNNVAYYMPPVLPTEFYVDASHPLSAGYAALAKQLFDCEIFGACILGAN
ncbi:MAG: hypothetical protein KAY65_05940 [Planctomycetes bacterium]|nr:hypothetical protein [Planctomycetota bacterium]